MLNYSIERYHTFREKKMKFKTWTKVELLASLGLFLSVLIFPAVGSAKDFQKTPVKLQASEILPKDLLSGSNYKVKEAVKNDGLVNTYELETNYGSLAVESTALLLIRINELRALQKMEQLKGTDVYSKALLAAGSSPLRTAKGLVTAPVKTGGAIVTGFGKWFSDVGRSIVSDDPHQADVMKTALGHAAVKRLFAFNFGVDPYSNYEPLRKELDDIAWTAVTGGLTAKAAFMAIPGGAGAAVSAAGTAGGVKELVRDKSPDELEGIIEKKLKGMGVSVDLARVFLRNKHFNPQEKTLLVGALANMKGVKDRSIVITAAVTADEEAVALYLRVRAQMMSHFSKSTPVKRFVEIRGTPFLLTKKGVIVGNAPLDHVLWTDRLSRTEKALSQAIEKMPGVKGKEIRFSGTVDPKALEALESRGWKVRDGLQDRLLKKLIGGTGK